jgi:hypothetical protein
MIAMVDETFKQIKPEKDFTDLIKYLKRKTPAIMPDFGQVVDIERVEGPYYMPVRWKVTLDNGVHFSGDFEKLSVVLCKIWFEKGMFQISYEN